MRSLAWKSTDDSQLVRHVSLNGARCQLLVAKTASTLWPNIILKRRDAVLAKVKDSVSFESFMNLWNLSISTGDELFPMTFFKKPWKRRQRSSMMKPSTRQ